MENISLRYVYDKNKLASDTKKGLIQIEVRINGTNKATYISTGFKIFPKQFSTKNGFTCVNHDKAVMITQRVRSIFNKIEAYAYSEDCRQLSDVKNWNKEKKQTISFIDYIKNELKKRNPSSAVLEHHNILINKLEEFGEIKTFKDITFENIDKFDAHLRKTINSQPVLYKRHNALKSYIIKAINLGYCSYNPYIDFKVVKGKNLKAPVFLTEDELKRIVDYKALNSKLQQVKDLFVFQCYTGLAYVDLAKFDKDWISETDGYKVIKSHRSKTDESFISLLLPEAEKVLEKYSYQLPVISNQKYNVYLKLLATGAKINKDISSHVARHTFATYLINKDIPIETVSRALGHSNIKQTQHYSRLLGKKVVSDMARLIKKAD